MGGFCSSQTELQDRLDKLHEDVTSTTCSRRGAGLNNYPLSFNCCISSTTLTGQSAVFPVHTNAARDGPTSIRHFRQQVRNRSLLIFRLGFKLYFYFLTITISHPRYRQQVRDVSLLHIITLPFPFLLPLQKYAGLLSSASAFISVKSFVTETRCRARRHIRSIITHTIQLNCCE